MQGELLFFKVLHKSFLAWASNLEQDDNFKGLPNFHFNEHPQFLYLLQRLNLTLEKQI
jgi:hypothetical protein